MRAMILAAGKGKRLMPLTEKTPKALIEVGGKKLIDYHIERLRDFGVSEIAINTGRLGQMVHEHLGDGSAYQVTIHYSDEGEQLLNTGGGIVKMLQWMADEPFVVISADVFTDYELHPVELKDGQAHLVVVDNPSYYPQGDFYWQAGYIKPGEQDQPANTSFAGIAYYTPGFFTGIEVKAIPLAEILHKGIAQSCVSAEKHTGIWEDVGNLERLERLHQSIAQA